MPFELDLANVVAFGKEPDECVAVHDEKGPDILFLQRLERLVDGRVGADGIHLGSLLPEDTVDRVVEFHRATPLLRCFDLT